MRVAKRIAYLRTASGITQEELASRLEIALKNVQRIESGRQNLTLSSVERIAVALRVDVRELFAKATAARQPEMRASATRRKLDGLAGPGRVVVNVGAEDPPPHAVPVTSLGSAASLLADGRNLEPVAWLIFTRSHPPEGSFVARVIGTAMEPTLHDGAWVLFGPPRAGSLVGRIVLIARDAEGSGTSGFLLRRVAAAARVAASKHHVLLRGDNAAFPPIDIELATLDELRVVAESRRMLK